MTEDKHMQKAREIVAGWRGRKGIVPWEDVETDIAAALSEAYRSGVEEERARCLRALAGMAEVLKS